MAPEDHTHPQDKGQGLSEGDRNDAASLAQTVFDPALKDVVVKGLKLKNLGSGTFDVSFGVAKIYVPSMKTKDYGDGQKIRDECLITQQVKKRTGIAYDGSGTTHVFLQTDLSVDDSVSIETNGDGAQPAEPSMKLGTIDEATDTPTHLNRVTGVADRTAQPTHSIPMAEMPSGDFADIPFYVPDGKTGYIWMWSARTAAQSTPGGLLVGLYDPVNGSYVASASTAYEQAEPLARVEGPADYRLRLENTTGGTVDAGSEFSATIE